MAQVCSPCEVTCFTRRPEGAGDLRGLGNLGLQGYPLLDTGEDPGCRNVSRGQEEAKGISPKPSVPQKKTLTELLSP